MVVDWSTILEKAPSIAMALLFAWFAFKLIETNNAFMKSLMDEHRQQVKERDDDWRTAISQHDQVMASITEKLTEVIARLSDLIPARRNRNT